MSNVIPLTRKEPHGHGEAFCFGCDHRWSAVVPVGITELECPECKTMKGRLTFAYTPPSGAVWECGCGNQLFHCDRDGVFCPNCGTYQNFPKDFK